MQIDCHQILGLYQQASRCVLVGERVTHLTHAWQCARLAEKSGASHALQLASWLHDIGHLWLMVHKGTQDGAPWAHEILGARLLAPLFGPTVSEPVRLHVWAKRFLVTTRTAYVRKLSPPSLQSLAQQGGTLSEEECAEFEQHPFFADAVQLRVWDDLGQKEGWFEDTAHDALEKLDGLMQSVSVLRVT